MAGGTTPGIARMTRLSQTATLASPHSGKENAARGSCAPGPCDQ